MWWNYLSRKQREILAGTTAGFGLMALIGLFINNTFFAAFGAWGFGTVVGTVIGITAAELLDKRGIKR